MVQESHEAAIHQAEQEDRMFKLEVEQALRPPPGEEENFAPMVYYKQTDAYTKVNTDECEDFDAELPAKTRPHTKDFGVRKMNNLIQRFDNTWSRRRRIAILVSVVLLIFGFTYFSAFVTDNMPAPGYFLKSKDMRVLRK